MSERELLRAALDRLERRLRIVSNVETDPRLITVQEENELRRQHHVLLTRWRATA